MKEACGRNSEVWAARCGQWLPGMAGKGNLPPGHCQGLPLGGRHATPCVSGTAQSEGWRWEELGTEAQGTGQPPRAQGSTPQAPPGHRAAPPGPPQCTGQPPSPPGHRAALNPRTSWRSCPSTSWLWTERLWEEHPGQPLPSSGPSVPHGLTARSAQALCQDSWPLGRAGQAGTTAKAGTKVLTTPTAHLSILVAMVTVKAPSVSGR